MVFIVGTRTKVNQNCFRSYNELIRYQTYEDRLNYLLLYGSVGTDTFGFDRYLNQMLYHSTEWKQLRQKIITRDLGCDLAMEGYDILSGVLIHHINPITVEDVVNHNPIVFDPNNLITTTHATHQIIHYGILEDVNRIVLTERKLNDTCPWRK